MGWLPCGIDPANQVSGCEPMNECSDCSLDLSNGGQLPPGTMVSFPYNFPNFPTIPWGTPMAFWLGDCIYDVDPLGIGELCCWCCACPAGWNQVDGYCNTFGNLSPILSNARQASTSFTPSSTNPPDCGIAQDGSFGAILDFGWVPCGYDSSGMDCIDSTI